MTLSSRTESVRSRQPGPHASDALLPVHPYPLSNGDGAVVAANALEVEEPFIIDVVHNEAEFVHVPGQHDPHGAHPD